jgi:hypothetical protein
MQRKIQIKIFKNRVLKLEFGGSNDTIFGQKILHELNKTTFNSILVKLKIKHFYLSM